MVGPLMGVTEVMVNAALASRKTQLMIRQRVTTMMFQLPMSLGRALFAGAIGFRDTATLWMWLRPWSLANGNGAATGKVDSACFSLRILVWMDWLLVTDTRNGGPPAIGEPRARLTMRPAAECSPAWCQTCVKVHKGCAESFKVARARDGDPSLPSLPLPPSACAAQSALARAHERE